MGWALSCNGAVDVRRRSFVTPTGPSVKCQVYHVSALSSLRYTRFGQLSCCGTPFELCAGRDNCEDQMKALESIVPNLFYLCRNYLSITSQGSKRIVPAGGLRLLYQDVTYPCTPTVSPP